MHPQYKALGSFEPSMISILGVACAVCIRSWSPADGGGSGSGCTCTGSDPRRWTAASCRAGMINAHTPRPLHVWLARALPAALPLLSAPPSLRPVRRPMQTVPASENTDV